MVFESLVTDLLNKYLGQYVENLDPSQLKIGIWGGNVRLENLELKDTALDDLDLPIRVVRGHLGKLHLSIPWKNLYHEATVVRIEDLYVLARPNLDIKYNEEKEEKAKFEKKKRQLENIEEARRREQEAKKKDGPKAEEQNSFAEKLATQVVKNLQVTVRNIHIRYEDSVTCPHSPFSVGFTLENLSAMTTDENFVPKIIKESVTMIHKLIELDSLAVYWNSNSEMLSVLQSKSDWIGGMNYLIAYKTHQARKMKYILKPINATKKMMINTKPGTNMDIPKIFLDLVMEELSLQLFKSQYHGLIELLESFERMNRNIPFRRYRPTVPLTADRKAWWHYAITSVLEEDIRRQVRMWSWSNMKKHREMCRSYLELYKKKLTSKKHNDALLKNLQALEQKLNVVSLTIYRQLAENEILREEKQSAKKSKKGWFGGLFSSEKDGGQRSKYDAKKIEELIPEKQRAEEMRKLYAAIGYSENEVITPFPREYVAVKFLFKLKRITIILKEDLAYPEQPLEVLKFALEDIAADVRQRPSSKGLRVESKIEALKLFGTPEGGKVPIMARSVRKADGSSKEMSLINVVFEINPLSKPGIQQDVKAVLEPMEMIYDASTVDQVFSFFKPPKDVILEDLQERAYSTFEELKVSSTAGLIYAMEQHTIMDVDVHLKASYLMLPEHGSLRKCSRFLLIDFGSLNLVSDPTQERIINPKEIDDLEKVKDQCYDKFLIQLRALQVLLCDKDSSWQRARTQESSTLHLLSPVAFDGKLSKSLVPDDPRLAQIKVQGTLSSLQVTLSDVKIGHAYKLVSSIPVPEQEVNKKSETEKGGSNKVSSSVRSIAGVELIAPLNIAIEPVSDDESSFATPPDSPFQLIEKREGPDFLSTTANQVKVDLDFTVQKIELQVCLDKPGSEHETALPCLDFYIDNINAKVKLRRWDMMVDAMIGRLVFVDVSEGLSGRQVELLSTPRDVPMLKVAYRQCFFNGLITLGPSWVYSDEGLRATLLYRDEFNFTEQIIDLKLAMVRVNLEQENLLRVMSLFDQIGKCFGDNTEEIKERAKAAADLAGSRLALTLQEKQAKKQPSKAAIETEGLKRKVGVDDEVQLCIMAQMDGVELLIRSSNKDLTKAHVKGLSSQVKVRNDMTQIIANMKDLRVKDCNKETLYKHVVAMENDQVFNLEVQVMNDATQGAAALDVKAVDTSVKLSIGRVKVVFLNKFVTDVVNFFSEFQAAQEVAKSAGQRAAATASSRITSYQQNSARHKLNITIQAPLILVPLDSKAEKALIMDLGLLRVFNSFSLVQGLHPEKGQQTAITDHMVIKLTDLKLSKSLVKDGKEIVQQRLLVEPVSLQLGIIRSLSPWTTSIPELEFSGVLKTVRVIVGEEDLRALMEVFTGNLNEAATLPVQAPVTATENKVDENVVAASTPLAKDERVLLTIEEERGKEVSILDVTWVKMLFAFEVENVEIDVYKSPKEMVAFEEFAERDPELCLGQFIVGKVVVTGSALSDESLKTAISLETIVLDDKRPDSGEGVTRMIEYAESISSRVSSPVEKNADEAVKKIMFSMVFEQTKERDKIVEVKVQNLLTVINVEYIMVLVNVFLSAMTPVEQIIDADKPSPQSSPTHIFKNREVEDNNKALNSLQTMSVPSSGRVGDDKVPETKVHLTVVNPQFVLLADAKDKNTNGLFLQTFVDFTYLERCGRQQMIALVSDTKVMSAAFEEERRKSTSSQVVMLSCINLHSSAPVGGKPHMHVSTSLISINLSPATIRTVMAVITKVSDTARTLEGVETEDNTEDMWEIEDVSNKKTWYLEATDDRKLTPGSMVWARKKDGFYDHGFLAQKDTHITVYFYPDGQVVHSIKDNTAVILDELPGPKDLRVGYNVICPGDKGFFEPARIQQIWVKENTDDQGSRSRSMSTEGEEGWEKVDGSGDALKYLVKFYRTGKEEWIELKLVRLLPKHNLSAMPGLGAMVYVRMKTGAFLFGRVNAIKEFKCVVNVPSLGESVARDLDDPTSVVINLSPRPSQVQPDMSVICARSKGNQFFPARVLDVQKENNEYLYLVRYEDGESCRVRLEQMCLLPKPNTDMLPAVGCFVFARASGDSFIYEKGVVMEKEKKVLVKFISGTRLGYQVNDIESVIWDAEPDPLSLRVGTQVLCSDDDKGMKMQRGRVIDYRQVSKALHYLVELMDGNLRWCTASKIRIIPQYGEANEEPENKQLEDVEAVRRENLVLEVEGIDVKIEGFLGGQLTPMLSFEFKMTGDVKDWSSKLNANFIITLMASYYNEKVAEWEPLIEPYATQSGQRPWPLSVTFTTNEELLSVHADDDEKDDIESDLAALQTPLTALGITSEENLEITLTDTSLSIIKNIGNLFSEAVWVGATQLTTSEEAPFIVENELGKDLTIAVGQALVFAEGGNEMALATGESITLYHSRASLQSLKISRHQQLLTPTISIQIEGFHPIQDVAVKRQRVVLFDIVPLQLLSDDQTYAAVVQVRATEGQRIITIRSPLQVQNHFPLPLEVLYQNKEGKAVLAATVDGNKLYSVPITVAYHAPLYIKPAGFGYDMTSSGIAWNDFSKEHDTKYFSCKGPSPGEPNFNLLVIAEAQKYTSVKGGLERFAPNFKLHLYPPVVIHNYLPTAMRYKTQEMTRFELLKGGDHWPLFNVSQNEKPTLEIQIGSYLGQTWTGSFLIAERRGSEPSDTVTLRSTSESENGILELGLFITRKGCVDLTLYSPYWMVNKTGKSLEYQASGGIVSHDHLEKGAVMIMARGKKKKAKVRVVGCEWSDDFPIDTIGSGGSLKSIGKRERAFEIGVGISVSYFSLTKIVTFTPLHMLTNHTKHKISVAEVEAEAVKWHSVSPGETVPFWPSKLPPKNLIININGKESAPFNPEPVVTVLLKMDREVGAVCVNYQEKDSSSLISFGPYFPGAAPVRIENFCPHISMITYSQVDTERTYVLCNNQSILYTWDEPIKKHELKIGILESQDDPTRLTLDKNDFGRIQADGFPVFWVSFLDGLQRVLLFTEDFKLAYRASQGQTLRPTQEISLNVEGLGLSLVNVEKRVELAYIGITKSDVVWEQRTRNRWKTMSNRESDLLEQGYSKFKYQKATGRVVLNDMEVDFENMLITKPKKVRVRRTFHSGLSLQYIVSPNLMQISAKISAVQIDSQVPGSTFNTVLHPIPPPKSIAAENAPKPVVEMSLTTRLEEKKRVNQISYFKVLVQEMDVRVDIGFLLALLELFSSETRGGSEREQYLEDMKTVNRTIEESPEFQAAQQDVRYFFDYFHLSPLKIHVSFSMTGSKGLQDNSPNLQANILNLLLQSVGVAFTEVEDVEFKLACFEVSSSLLSQQQLTDAVAKHYQHQAIRQLYVLVFGLDVLGNPYGLISNITTGAKNFFYEPYQGLIQGPEEFAEGLALGVKSLVGSTVGGAAGAASRITGTLGKGLAALTMDDSYQQERRHAMSQRPTNLGQGIVKGGKGLVKGVFSGITGIVTKPVEGAKKEGATGFFKGVGKGLIGVVARPAGGVVDLASNTFEGLKSTAGGHTGVKQLRPARAFHADKVLRPFSQYEANGAQVLREANKGKFRDTDYYFAHVSLNPKTLIMLTNRNVLFIIKTEVLGDWDVKWFFSFTQLKSPPEVVDGKNVIFRLYHMESAKRQGIGKNVTEKNVTFPDGKLETPSGRKTLASWFVGKVHDAQML